MENKKMKIGLNVFSNEVAEEKERCFLPLEGNVADYVVCHFDCDCFSVEDNPAHIKKVGEVLGKHGLEYVANFEFVNFNPSPVGPDGYDWANREDGTHLLNLPDEYVKAHASNPNFVGLMYDEFEHVIINRNISVSMATKWKKVQPAFPLLDKTDTVKQGELLSSQLGDYWSRLKNSGAPALSGEHVFPVLFHTFARNGITPNFKSQKESASNIQYAIAGGAALQYGTDLWNCVDLWYRLTNPGHSSDEMYHNLKFAYLAGVTRVYVESCHPMTKDGQLTEYGVKYREFCKEYKGKERDYCIHDYRPEIGIIRYDDTFWGQCDPVMWKPILFGNKKIKPTSQSREYLKAFSIITHGETCPNGISWGRVSPWSLRKHRSFVTMNSTAVFDDRVEKDKLSSLKLCFLCGVHIEESTLKAVGELVRENGLTVVTSPRYLPDGLKSKVKGSCTEINDGKGKWIVVRSFRNGRMKKLVKPFLGSKGEIRLTFADREIRLKISENGETFKVL